MFRSDVLKREPCRVYLYPYKSRVRTNLKRPQRFKIVAISSSNLGSPLGLEVQLELKLRESSELSYINYLMCLERDN